LHQRFGLRLFDETKGKSRKRKKLFWQMPSDMKLLGMRLCDNFSETLFSMRNIGRHELLLVLFFALAITTGQILLRILVNDSAVPFSFGISFPIAILTGFLFVVSIRYLRNKMVASIVVDVGKNEAVLRASGANHIVAKEGVGGKLVLTDRRLIFVSHKFNVQNHRFETSIDEVLAAEPIKFWKLFDTGLLLELKKGEQHKFVVNSPAEWITSIRERQRAKAL